MSMDNVTMSPDELRGLAAAIERHSAVYAELERHDGGVSSHWRMIYPDFDPIGDLVRVADDGSTTTAERGSAP